MTFLFLHAAVDPAIDKSWPKKADFAVLWVSRHPGVSSTKGDLFADAFDEWQ